MTHPRRPPAPEPIDRSAWSRRAFITGALATGVLVACGGSENGADGADGTNGTDGSDGAGSAGTAAGGAADVESGADVEADTYFVVQRFPQGMQVPGSQRLPISLAIEAAIVDDGPATLRATVVDGEGETVGATITATRRDVESGAYYDFRPAVPEVGIYSLVVDGGPADGAAFQVVDPAEVPVPTPGDPLPPFDTPTVEDPRGVDPICTQTPDPCPFHEVTLTEALAGDTVVAYYVGTPAFCSTGSCGPALESMVELREEFADTVTFVHAEVYTDTTATEVTEAVNAIGLTYEPALFIADADGVVVERLDAVWNVDELRETLTRIVG